MYFLGDIQNKELSKNIAQRLRVEVRFPEITIFEDGERRVRIVDEILGEDVYILKSTASPVEENIFELCFLIDAAVRHGARRVMVISPYVGYMRADHVFREGEAVPLEIVIKTIEGAGANKLWMIDPHSIRIPEMFVIPIVADSAISIFADKIREISSDLGNVSLVSPDMGGIRRLDLLSEELGGVDKIIINKDRDLETGGVKVVEVMGKVRELCFVVDDIIATGGTMIEAIEPLKKAGAKRVYIMGTHPVFAGKAAESLSRCGTEKVYITDSIFVPDTKRFENLEILTLADKIVSQIRVWEAQEL